MYWNFLWMHPSHALCPSRAIPDAADSLTWYYVRFAPASAVSNSTALIPQADNLISGPRSTVPFSKAECEDLMRVVKDMTREFISVGSLVLHYTRVLCSSISRNVYRQSRLYRMASPGDLQLSRCPTVWSTHSEDAAKSTTREESTASLCLAPATAIHSFTSQASHKSPFLWYPDDISSARQELIGISWATS